MRLAFFSAAAASAFVVLGLAACSKPAVDASPPPNAPTATVTTPGPTAVAPAAAPASDPSLPSAATVVSSPASSASAP